MKDNPLPLLARLKDDTAPFHRRLDSHELLRKLLLPDLDSRIYVLILEAFYTFYTPLEMKLEEFSIDLSMLGLDLKKRHKSGLLRHDIASYGKDLNRLRLCTDLPAIESIGQALGCVYVLEGSTLGGQIIQRHISRSVRASALVGGSFFASYGTDVYKMWEEVRSTLSRFSGPSAEVVETACATFTSLENWLSASALQEIQAIGHQTIDQAQSFHSV